MMSDKICSSLIFINENENIYEVLAEKEIDINKIKDNIKIISAKINNNRIGYFQFKINNGFIKICILPKIIKKDDKNLEEKYLNYINKYFEIINKYQKQITKKVTDNYLDIILSEKNNEIKSFNSLLNYKYIVALDEIYKFFKHYKKFIYKQKSCIANEFKYKIDLKKNITEINKTKIHQNLREEISYSKISDITQSVIDCFLKEKINSLEDKEKVEKKSIEVSRFLSKRYEINNFKFDLKKILSYKIRSLFKSKKLQVLYKNLLVLLDLEGYFEKDCDSQILNKISNMTCITFDPAVIFEYYVYHKHIEENIPNTLFIKLNYDIIKKVYTLYFKTKVETKEFLDESIIMIEEIKENSEPDLIIGNVIKDCKWKILKSLNDISREDFLKLKRDCLIRNYNKGVLVYPQIECEYKNFILEIDDENFTEGIFTFQLEECRVID